MNITVARFILERCVYKGRTMVRIPMVYYEQIMDALNDKETIENMTQKDGYNLQELWKRARAGETLNKTELNFLLADWDGRNISKLQEEGREAE